MLKFKLAVVYLGVAMMLSWVPAFQAQTPAAPLPSQILTAKNAFIANAGGLLEPKAVSGDPRRDYNQFYAAMQAWGRYSLVASPAEADLVVQISIIYLPIETVVENGPVPTFRVALLDPKTNATLWVLDEPIVDKPSLSLILKKNRDKLFDAAIDKLVSDLKVLTAAPVDAVK